MDDSNAPASVGAFGVSETSIDGLLDAEVRQSLALRARAMSWVLGITTLNLVVVFVLMPSIGRRLVPADLPLGYLLGMVGLLWLLEIGILVEARRTGKTSAKHPWLEQGVSILEVSAVSGFLFLAASWIDPPLGALLGPGSWMYFPLIAASTLTLKPQIVAVTGVMATAQFLAIAIWLTGPDAPSGTALPQILSATGFHVQKGLLLLLTTIVASAVAFDMRRRMRRVTAGVREQARIVSLFGQHTSPEVVETLLASGGELEPERRAVGILFLDIRGFTAASEEADPAEVVERLNRFFDLVLPCVTEQGGIIHQLLGDGFMAIFGAPVRRDDAARRTLACALEIHRRVAEAADQSAGTETQIVIGAHYGEVVAGPVGAADHREYKVTGDAVNVAARLETIAKDRGATILTSRDAVHAAGLEAEVAEDLGDLEIRGRRDSLRVLRLR